MAAKVAIVAILGTVANGVGAYYGVAGYREFSKSTYEAIKDGSRTGSAVIDSVGQFTDGFTITIKLCSRGKLYS